MEGSGRKNLYRALMAALFSSPIVVTLIVKYLDPVALYKAYTAAPPPPPPAPVIVVTAEWTPFQGMFRKGLFQSANKYTLGEMDFQIKNQGNATSEDLYYQITFADSVTIEKVTGDWGMEFKDIDGTFKPIEQAKDWNQDVHYIVIHIPKLEATFGETGQIAFFYDTGKSIDQPSMQCWDTLSKYNAVWKSADGK
jgi:hypothetical protein